MDKAIKFLDNILALGDTVICATSGGVDSMTLLNMLIDYRKKVNINIVCAHINHNLREESFEEYEFVKSFCEENNVVFEGTIFPKHEKGNFESESRKKRYAYFEELINKYNAKYLLTAHHGDDLIETILMRIIRGSTIEGYKGFNMISNRDNYKILRPLIYYSKDDIKEYASKNNIEYREDKTNYDTKYTRNRYRKEILPILKNEDKDIHLKFLKFSEKINEECMFINKYVSNVYNNIYVDGMIDLNKIDEVDDFILKKVILIILSNIYKENINYVNDKHVLSIIDVMHSKKSNMMINLPLNIIVYKNYNYLEIRNSVNYSDYKIEIKDDDIVLPDGILKKVDSTNLTNNYVCHLNSKDITLPLYVRNKKDGDYIEVLNLNGKKKVKDIFIDEKIEKEKRISYPFVVDSNDNILWIPGLKKSKYDGLKSKNYDIILWYVVKEENNE